MIMERTVYDVKCSQCWKTISAGHQIREDAQIDEERSSVVINGREVALCANCERTRKDETP